MSSTEMKSTELEMLHTEVIINLFTTREALILQNLLICVLYSFQQLAKFRMRVFLLCLGLKRL